MIPALHFLRPWWWLALLPLPFVLIALARSGSGSVALKKLADAILLPYLVRDEGAHKRLALALATIAWLLAVAALSGPAWQRAPAPLYANGAARVVALSLSDDMLAQDLKPDRITRARYAVRDLLDAAGDARTALIGYAGDAFVVAPLTPDKQTVLNLLDALAPDTMPVQGNDAARAIGQGVALLQQAQVRGGDIVLVTDDADTAAIDAARKARAAGVRIDVLGVGTAQGAPVPSSEGGFAYVPNGSMRLAQRDDAALREIAQAGGGRYAPLQTDGNGVAALGQPSAEQSSADSHEQAQLWRDGGAWLLLPLLPLAALAFRRGWLCVLVLALVAPHARASAWDALWARPDQRAAGALQRGDYAAAAKSARDPLLRGAAAYRGGDYTLAAKHFAERGGVQADYDLGNALAKGGHYRQAIAAYDKALQGDPKMADARANRDAVLEWLRRHPPQGQQGSNGKQGTSSPSTLQKSGSSSNAQSSSGSKNGAQNSQSATQNSVQASQSGQSSEASGNSDKSADKSPNGNTSAGDSGASKNEDAHQREQTQRAQRALRQELVQQAQTRGNAARQSAPRGDEHQAFALGDDQTQNDRKFDPQQRAMLNAVPDDPGALLRRKFLLEWQRRNGQTPEDDGQ